ncbi:XK-related protein 2 [Arapaima gigas]
MKVTRIVLKPSGRLCVPPPEERPGAAAVSLRLRAPFRHPTGETEPPGGPALAVARGASEPMPGCVAVTRVRGHPPFSVLFWALLYCAELASAAVLCAVYGDARERLWTAATLVFALVPALLTQLALTFVHRDLGRDRPLVLLLHLLLLGPVVSEAAEKLRRLLVTERSGTPAKGGPLVGSGRN